MAGPSRNRVSRAERAILSALAQSKAVPDRDAALSGREIAQAVDTTTRGAVRIQPGGLYTTLSRLVQKKLIQPVRTGRGRTGKLYQLTPIRSRTTERPDPPGRRGLGTGSEIRGMYGEYVIEKRLDLEMLRSFRGVSRPDLEGGAGASPSEGRHRRGRS